MGENTKIEWADHTLNPWIGCTKVSPACDHCYAENWAKRTGNGALWSGERRRTTEANWRQPLKWDLAARKAGRRARVFCASLADVFDNQIPAEWRNDLWHMIRCTMQLDWLLLTKRPQNIRKMLPPDWGYGYPNVWLGATAEDQYHFDTRWPHISRIPAVCRFLSYEPALGPLDIGLWPMPQWVIYGGESGYGARPPHPSWPRAIRDQCAKLGVPFLMKQHGEWLSTRDDDAAGGVISYGGNKRFAFGIDGPEEEWVYRVGKKLAGRLLDGRTHDEFPRAY